MAGPTVGAEGESGLDGGMSVSDWRTGWEGLASLPDDAQPARTIPRALAMALVSVTLLYVAIQITAQGILGASLSHPTTKVARISTDSSARN